MWLPLLPLPVSDLARLVPVQSSSHAAEDTQVASEPEIFPKPQDPELDTAYESIKGHAVDITHEQQSLHWAVDGIQMSNEAAKLRKRNAELQRRAEVVEKLCKGIKELQKRNEGIEALRKRNEELKTLLIELQTKLTHHEILYEKAKARICMHESRTESLQRRIKGLYSPFLHRFRFEQVSESKIQDRFNLLCLRLASWVVSQFPWKDSTRLELTKPIFLNNGDPYLATFLNDDDRAGDSIIGSLTHQCLQREVFGEHVYLVGLRDDYSNFLLSIQTCMARLRRYPERTREVTIISQWRSETLKALAFQPDIIEMRNTHGLSATERIFSFVKQFYPSVTNRQQSFTELYEQVVMPSIALAVDMQTSWSQYTFIPAMNSPKNLYNFEKVKLDLITSVTAVDAKTRIPLSKDEPVVCDSDGFIGIPIMLVEPALYMNKHSNHSDDTLWSLRRGTYLIELFHQLDLDAEYDEEQSESSSADACRLDEKIDLKGFRERLIQFLNQNYPEAVA